MNRTSTLKRTGFVSKRKQMSRTPKRKTLVELATDQLIPKQPSERFTAKEAEYYAWLHEHCVCCITGQTVFQILHTGKKHMAMKSPLDTFLPVIFALHVIEERDRATFWNTVGLPDFAKFAKRLFAAFEAGESPDLILQEMHSKIDRDYVHTLFGQIDY